MPKTKTEQGNSSPKNQNLLYGKFIDPESVTEKLDMKPGMKVADFGCGTGYFVFPIAKKIGNSGVVYALDVVKEKLESVESRAKLEGFSNVIALRTNLESENGSGLEKESVDWVILVNMLFQNENKEVILKESASVLKKGGQILVIEWNEKFSPFGPGKNLRLSKEKLEKMAEKENLKKDREIEISDFHYGLIFVK